MNVSSPGLSLMPTHFGARLAEFYIDNQKVTGHQRVTSLQDAFNNQAPMGSVRVHTPYLPSKEPNPSQRLLVTPNESKAVYSDHMTIDAARQKLLEQAQGMDTVDIHMRPVEQNFELATIKADGQELHYDTLSQLDVHENQDVIRQYLTP